jgi:phosphoketolase
MAAGNIIFGGPIGAGVDAATGAAFDYPSLIKVLMEGKKQ